MGGYVLLRFSFAQLLWVVVLAAGLLAFGSDRAEAKTTQVVVNGRGPYMGTRDLDLSQGVAQQLGLTGAGVDYVEATYPGGPQAAGSLQAVADSLGIGGPPPQAGAAVDESSGAYLVQPGDSLSEIAAQFGTSTGHLMAQNGIPNPNLIYGGQTLLL
jgi:rare lipoprotein A